MQSIGMSIFLRSLGDCRISFSGSGEFRISHGMMYSYLAKKSSMSQTMSFTQRQMRHGSHRDEVGVEVLHVGLAGQAVRSIDVHGATAADGRPAAVPERQTSVVLLLDVEQPFENREVRPLVMDLVFLQ